MKKRPRANQKKGAIELSMTTIIVIVMGITLLSLGLVFIKGIFSKINELTEGAFRNAEEEIERNMAPDQKFYVGGITIKAKPGKEVTVSAGVQNFGTAGTSNKFALKVDPKPGSGGSALWFTLPPEIDIATGGKGALPFIIEIPKNIATGTFPFTIVALKDNQFYENKIIMVIVES